MFTDAEIKSYANDDTLRLALRRSEVDFIFGDAIALAFWINGTDSGECCAFSVAPSSRAAIRRGIASPCARQRPAATVAELGAVPDLGKGRFTDLWLRYFSISPF